MARHCVVDQSCLHNPLDNRLDLVLCSTVSASKLLLGAHVLPSESPTPNAYPWAMPFSHTHAGRVAFDLQFDFGCRCALVAGCDAGAAAHEDTQETRTDGHILVGYTVSFLKHFPGGIF